MNTRDAEMLACQAVLEGGRIARNKSLSSALRAKESARDIVTAADLAIERAIINTLSAIPYPVLSEEGADDSPDLISDAAPTWIVDPIDGTANYAAGLEYYGICIGLKQGVDFPVGAVYLPRLEELYTTQARRATLNGQRLKFRPARLDSTLVGASFSGAFHDAEHRSAQYALFGIINDRTRGCLRLGSTAVNICFTASGRLQAAYGLRTKIWDVAGAIAVAIAAGCEAIVAPCHNDPLSVDYFVGAHDAVTMIHAECLERHLSAPDFWRWNS